MTVLFGGIPVTFASTGVVGVPLAFLVIMCVLGLLVVGYAGVSRRVSHPAPFFALLTLGLGGRAGMSAATVEFLGYNAIQTSLFPFLGARVAGLWGGPWWLWALAAWVVVLLLGRAPITTNTGLLGGMLLVELAVIVLAVVAAFSHPAVGQVDMQPWRWQALVTDGAGGALAFCMAAFVGFELAPSFSEEARSPRTMMRATFVVTGCLGVLYALLGWAVWVGVGPQVLSGADPGEVVFAALARIYGPGVRALATVLLFSSVLAALISFHHVVGRNLFGLARDEVLPARIRTVSRGQRGGVPRAASMVQSVVAAVVIVVVAWAGFEPMDAFTWLSVLGALSILVLLVFASVAAYAYYRTGGGRGHESAFMRMLAPLLGAVTGALVVLFMASNLHSLLNLPQGSRQLGLLLPVVIAAFAAAGWWWGAILKRRRPDIYQRLGHGTPPPLTVLDHDLSGVKI